MDFNQILCGIKEEISSLASENFREITLAEFTNNITGYKHQDYVPCAHYKSANTDVLTRIILTVSPKTLQQHIEDIADAVGYEGAFHISLSPEGLPALSGGGCLSARDLARFGLIFARAGQNIHGEPFANYKFLSESFIIASLTNSFTNSLGSEL